MNIHYLQHVPFEGLGRIDRWLEAGNHQLTGTQLYRNSPLPEVDDFDWLIVMGGPMGVEDETKYFWLKGEKEFIHQSIAACSNQGFLFDNRVLELQFHLETTPGIARALVNNCRDELDGSRYVQSEDEILADSKKFSRINQVMVNILNCLETHSAAKQ